MKLFFKSKDGGKESNVIGYWLIEWKNVFSIVLLCFDEGSREVFHNHAFNAISWILTGKLCECIKEDGSYYYKYLKPSCIPLYTSRDRMHKVEGIADKTWVLSFRGPWNKTWNEFFEHNNKYHTLTNGRIIVDETTK
jgi:hypothetical protein